MSDDNNADPNNLYGSNPQLDAALYYSRVDQVINEGHLNEKFVPSEYVNPELNGPYKGAFTEFYNDISRLATLGDVVKPTIIDMMCNGLAGEGDRIFHTLMNHGIPKGVLMEMINDFVLTQSDNENPGQKVVSQKFYAKQVIMFIIGATTSGISVIKNDRGILNIRINDEIYNGPLVMIYNWAVSYRSDIVRGTYEGGNFKGFTVDLSFTTSMSGAGSPSTFGFAGIE